MPPPVRRSLTGVGLDAAGLTHGRMPYPRPGARIQNLPKNSQETLTYSRHLCRYCYIRMRIW
jgi:hypothetical protein